MGPSWDLVGLSQQLGPLCFLLVRLRMSVGINFTSTSGTEPAAHQGLRGP